MEVREPGAGQRDPAERVGLSWRRSVSAPATDPPVHRRAQGGDAGPVPICRVLTESGCRTGPVHLTHAARSRPPSKRSISDAALDERILALRAEPFNATLGSRKTWRLPGSRQEGPGVARCTAGAAHAGAGTDRRRAGPDGAHHRARQGEPGPRSARCAAGSRRRPPKPALGGRLRAPRGAVRSGGDERASGPACRGGPVEAGGSPIPGTGVRAGSGPDNDGTHQYCQMVRARLARRRGIRRGTSG